MLEISWVNHSIEKTLGSSFDSALTDYGHELKDKYLRAVVVYQGKVVEHPSASITKSLIEKDYILYILAYSFTYKTDGEIILCTKTMISDDVRFLKQTAETWLLLALLSPQEKPKFLSSESYFDEETRIMFTDESDIQEGVPDYDVEEEDIISEIELYLKNFTHTDDEED